MSLTFAPGAVLTHSNIRVALEAASRILEAEGHPAIRVVDGDRSYQAQVTVFLARYVLGDQIRGRRVYDIRKWEGRTYYRISPAGTVAAPSRLAPHVRGVAADLGAPYNNRNTAAHKRLQQLAPGLGLDWTGRYFAEDWHWETTRGPGPAGEIVDDKEGFLMTLDNDQQKNLAMQVTSTAETVAELKAVLLEGRRDIFPASPVTVMFDWVKEIRTRIRGPKADRVKDPIDILQDLHGRVETLERRLSE